MSNSIWKTPDQKPDRDEPILFLAGVGCVPQKGWYYKKTDCFGNRASKNVHKWAYFDEWLADICITERLQKAVDLAVHTLNEICAGVPSDKWVFDEATKATNEIKQLIKGGNEL